MNTLFARGLDRSRCFWRASFKACTLSTSTAGAPLSSVRDPRTMMCHHGLRRALYTTANTLTPLHSAVLSTGSRRLSSLNADTITTTSREQSDTSSPRRLSAIEKANLPILTPGHAIRILQIHAAKGAQLIRNTDFHKLCNSSRPGKKRDAKVIATALRDFKRCNKYILHREGARMAIQGMMRSMVPNHKVVYGRPRLEAAVFVLEQILDETTGLYFATETFMVDRVLTDLYKSLNEMDERGVNLRVAFGEDESESDELSEEEKMLRGAAKVTEGVVKLLVKRRSRPENEMKKRAKRKYLRYLQVNDGPEVSTMKLATEICLAIGGSEYTKTNIIAPYTDAWWSRGSIDESIHQLVVDAEARELTETVVAEASDEGNVEDEDEGGDMGSSEGGEENEENREEDASDVESK